jgi:NADH-quinone oxidoreductase subunit G
VRAGYIFNTTIAGIEQADALPAHRRFRPAQGSAAAQRPHPQALACAAASRSASSAPAPNLTYAGRGPRATADVLAKIADGSTRSRSGLKDAKKPMMIVGMAPSRRPDGARSWPPRGSIADTAAASCATAGTASTCCTPPPPASAASTSASCRRRGGKDMRGILDGGRQGRHRCLVFLLGADEFDTAKLGRAFVVYQGTTATAGATAPTSSCRGRLHREGRHSTSTPKAACRRPARRLPAGRRARGLEDPAGPLGRARQNRCRTTRWSELRRKMAKAPARRSPGATRCRRRRMGALRRRRRSISGTLRAAGRDYYMTDPICRASRTMAQCSELFVRGGKQKTGTHG